jgi:hypothetical protein
VKLTNVGVARALEWAPADATGPEVRLTSFTGESFKPHGGPDRPAAALYPGKSVDRVFLFAFPTRPAGDLRLEFGPVVAGTDPVRFRIPKAMLPVPPRGGS